jgi:hypothetical protein
LYIQIFYRSITDIFISDAIKFANGYVSNEHNGMQGGLVVDILWDISDRKVNRPGTLSPRNWDSFVLLTGSMAQWWHL